MHFWKDLQPEALLRYIIFPQNISFNCFAVLVIVAPLATRAHIVAADLDPTRENTIATDTHMSLLNIMAILTDNLAAILKVSYEK